MLCEDRWFLPSHCGSRTRWSIAPRLICVIAIRFHHRSSLDSCEQPTPRPLLAFQQSEPAKNDMQMVQNKIGGVCVCVFACCIMFMFSMHESKFKEKENKNYHWNVRVCVLYCTMFMFFKHKSQRAQKKPQKHCVYACVCSCKYCTVRTVKRFTTNTSRPFLQSVLTSKNIFSLFPATFTNTFQAKKRLKAWTKVRFCFRLDILFCS